MSQNNHQIEIKQYSKEGKLNNTYSPLQNLIKDDDIGSFTTKNLTYGLTSHLNIDTQLSYDDSINLILNNDEESPRIINSQFRVKGNSTYEYLTREQGLSTNLYKNENIISSTDLFLRTNKWPIIDLIDIKNDGTLMGGNYVFYIKYCDEDLNEGDIVSESGIVSIFKGDSPSTSLGTILDERSQKSIELQISNLDIAFNKFYIYFTRETCDLNGVILTKYYKITEPFDIKDEINTININGYESINEISGDELVINYNYFSSAKTQAVVQNMLFLGNVKTSERHYPKLQQLSYKIKTILKQKDESIGYVNSDYSLDWTIKNGEYYSPKNIYYYLGYWPEEYYKLGICYILNDGTTTPAFSLYGGQLEKDKAHGYDGDVKLEVNKLISTSNDANDLIDTFNNTGGVFKLPKYNIIDHNAKTVRPLYFEFNISTNLATQLMECGVKGFFFVRTKRNPVSLFQGLSVGVDKESGIPMPYIETGEKTGYVAESFLNRYDENEEYWKDDVPNKDRDWGISRLLEDNINAHLRSINKNRVNNYALLALDPIVVPQLKSLLSWNEYFLDGSFTCKLESYSGGSRLYNINKYRESVNQVSSNLVYIEENIPSFYINDFYYSTRAGNSESAREFEFLGAKKSTEKTADNLIRGIYSPIIGSSETLEPSTIYTVKIKIENEDGWWTSLLNNTNQYFSITNRYSLSDDKAMTISAFRGDCFTSTVTIRLNKNFIDPTFPSNDKIVDESTWRHNYKGLSNMVTTSDKPDHKDAEFSWANINLGDLNSVPLGQWISFKCLSNYNLGLRSIDTRDVDIMGKLGSQGSSFYPISGFNTSANGKMPESQLLNEGYSITLPRKSYNKWTPSPYENWNFENRIAFSNIASTKMFTNGFRVFQGLAYQDIDKQFGQIVKLFPYAQNLLCVFEHGLAVVPINEKALLSTQEGLSIHLYGAGVLQEQVSVISPDYGSTWMESLIKTPDAYYGVDTIAKKIWKFNNTEGFQCISDFKIQSFLNENLNIDWDDKFFMGATNVRTHYNNFKGDVIFTFYNENNAYSLCYNERMKMWVSRYTWMPLLSANIDNQFYSFDRSVVEKYTNVWKQSTINSGIVCENPFYNMNGIVLKYNGILSKNIDLRIKSISVKGEIWYNTTNFVPITNGNRMIGMYFNKGIPNLMHKGGTIFKQIDDTNRPIYWDKLENKWKLIINHTSTEDIYSDKLILLPLFKPTFNDIEYTSCVPITIFDNEPDENGNIDYTDHELYVAYIEHYNNEFKLFLPQMINNDTEVKVEIEAYYNDELVESRIIEIGDNLFTPQFNLYKHDINSDICHWYDSQHPFEYEFVVNQPAGFHKIFNNLMIISNNVEPDSLEVEIVGDVYDFKEEFISPNENIKYKFPIISLPNDKTYQTKLTLDKVTNEHRLLTHQGCLNIKDFGRRLGNISYIEGKWYIVLQPIYYEDKTLKTTRLRDKWAKIRIKYSGEKLAIITAIQTLMNISYA